MKLLGLLACSVIVLATHRWPVLLGGCGLALGLYVSLGSAGKNRLQGLRLVLPLILALGAFQALVMNIDMALASVARVMLMIMLADLVTATTSMQEIMRAIAPVLRPFSWAGFDVSRLSIAVALMIRFIPVLLAQWQAQSESWRARSQRRPWAAIIPPFMAMTLRRADHIADSLAARRRS